jgi:hypothetical protein
VTSCIQPVKLRAVVSSETMPRIGSLSGSISTVTRSCRCTSRSFQSGAYLRTSQLVLVGDVPVIKAPPERQINSAVLDDYLDCDAG